MNEVIEQDNRFPEWLKAWNAKAAEIDEKIINFFTGGRDHNEAGAVNDLSRDISAYWDKQDLDPTARKEYEEARKDEKYMQQRIQSRVDSLNKEGKFTNKTGTASGS
jgi:hypothetical protein